MWKQCAEYVLSFLNLARDTHANTAAIHAALERENIHVMHHAGRIRIAVAGYNTAEDVGRLLAVLARAV